MRHLINKLTGGDMWVADNREKEYLAAGHKPAADAVKLTDDDRPLATSQKDKTPVSESPEAESPAAKAKTKKDRGKKELKKMR